MTVNSSDNKTNFPRKLLLNDTKILRTCEAFPNNSSANIRLSKSKLSKMIQLKGMRFFNFLAAQWMLQRNEIIKIAKKHKVME